MSMEKSRLDVLLVERGLAESRSLAQRLVMAGQVRVNGQVVLRAATSIPRDALLEVDQGPRYASRGGEKLEAAFQSFPVKADGYVCADVGSSTGGFTDCLLQHGAIRVYAIDVGHGILDWKLRQDARVVVMEDTNARFVETLPELIQLVTIDVSFISLKIILPVVAGWLPKDVSGGSVLALVKPQFEAGRHEVSRGKGVIRDPRVHRQVLLDVLGSTVTVGYALRGLICSPITGPKGNVEFLAWLEYPAAQDTAIEALVDLVVPTQE